MDHANIGSIIGLVNCKPHIYLLVTNLTMSFIFHLTLLGKKDFLVLSVRLEGENKTAYLDTLALEALMLLSNRSNQEGNSAIFTLDKCKALVFLRNRRLPTTKRKMCVFS